MDGRPAIGARSGRRYAECHPDLPGRTLKRNQQEWRLGDVATVLPWTLYSLWRYGYAALAIYQHEGMGDHIQLMSKNYLWKAGGYGTGWRPIRGYRYAGSASQSTLRIWPTFRNVGLAIQPNC